MHGFLYYIEGEVQKPERLRLASLGLGHVFDARAQYTGRGVQSGPGGCGAGTVLMLSGSAPDALLGYFPERQEWREMAPELVAAGMVEDVARGTLQVEREEKSDGIDRINRIDGMGEGGNLPPGFAGPPPKGDQGNIPLNPPSKGDQLVPRVWLGWVRGGMPDAEGLAREQLLPGHDVNLGLGGVWHVPKARKIEANESGVGYTFENALPRVARFQGGVWSEGGVPAHLEELWQIAERWWAAMFGAAQDAYESDEVVFTFDAFIESALRVLQVNYRVGIAEADALGLFDQERAAAVLNAAVDLPTWNRLMLKKKRTLRDAGLSGGGAE
jgi:hypothetical protein